MTLQRFTQSLPARIAALLTLFCATLAIPKAAHAELKLCNSTGSRIGVAIGYKDKDGWTSEGWWNVDSASCALLVQDKLRARFYYVYAFDYDKGGEWGGEIPMCTNDVEFTIKGIGNCEGRGFKKSGFLEVDTQEQSDWTVKLSDSGAAPVENASNPPNSSAYDRTPMQGVTGGSLPALIRKRFVRAATPQLDSAATPQLDQLSGPVAVENKAVAAEAPEPSLPVMGNQSQCDQRACASKYSSFRASDCTYQPFDGPRRLCEKGISERVTQARPKAAAVLSSGVCDRDLCARHYRSFDPETCTYQPFEGGPRQKCEKGALRD